MYEIDTGVPGSVGGGSRTLPFANGDLAPPKQLLVHFAVATDDPALRAELAKQIDAALRPMRTSQGHQLIPIITTTSVEMSYTTIQALAAYVTPVIKQLLGIRE